MYTVQWIVFGQPSVQDSVPFFELNRRYVPLCYALVVLLKPVYSKEKKKALLTILYRKPQVFCCVITFVSSANHVTLKPNRLFQGAEPNFCWQILIRYIFFFSWIVCRPTLHTWYMYTWCIYKQMCTLNLHLCAYVMNIMIGKRGRLDHWETPQLSCALMADVVLFPDLKSWCLFISQRLCVNMSIWIKRIICIYCLFTCFAYENYHSSFHVSSKPGVFKVFGQWASELWHTHAPNLFRQGAN